MAAGIEARRKNRYQPEDDKFDTPAQRADRSPEGAFQIHQHQHCRDKDHQMQTARQPPKSEHRQRAAGLPKPGINEE